MRSDFLKVGGDSLRLLCRNMCPKISAPVDEGAEPRDSHGQTREQRPSHSLQHNRQLQSAANHNSPGLKTFPKNLGCIMLIFCELKIVFVVIFDKN